jgi:hypothetical protein
LKNIRSEGNINKTIKGENYMSNFQKLKDLNLSEDTVVSLSYSEGTDVFVHNETEVETALSATDVVSTFAELIATPGLQAETQYGGNVLQSLRDEGHLDGYDREGYFAEYLAETISENFYDVDVIEYSTEKYDHKRGFCTLSADVKVTYGNIMSASPYLGGWTVNVPTENGTLTLG